MIDYLDKLSVLVIEDNLGDYILIEDYLQEKFKHVHIKHCINYKDADNYFLSNKDDVSIILLDLHLPDMMGMDLIDRMISLNLQAPIIILTGYSDLSMTKNSLKLGIYDYLVKDDINADILQRTIIYALNRKGYVNQLQDAKLSYEQLFNFSPQPVWLIDSKSLKLLNANFAAIAKYGYSLDELLEKSFLDFHPKDEIPYIEQKLLSNEVNAITNHFTHILKNGKNIKVEIYFSQIINPSFDGLIVLSNDVTETLKHINIIENQNDKLRTIAWTQSHVVRAPLSRILGIMNLIEGEDVSPEDLSFWHKQLRISTNEMDEIVKTIIKESKGFDNI